MFKKNSSKKANGHDFTALDAAVSELSKQTQALLGSTDAADEKSPKPTMPTKKAAVRPRGKSFDIIHNPNRRVATKATLKVAQPVKRVATAPITEPAQLLPDHAVLSFNEVEPDPEQNTTDAHMSEETPLVKHRENSLALKTEDAEKSEPVELVTDEDATKDEPPTTAHEPLSFDETPASNEEPSTKEASSNPDEADTEVQSDHMANASTEATQQDSADEHEQEDAESSDPAEPPAYNSGELFANNLVKDTKKKSYKPEANQQMPTVFDTNEYHPELHDWSKLEHSGGLSWIVLLGLLVVAGGVAYFVLSGQTFPFL